MKADRLVSLLLLLQSGQYRSARDLAARLEVSRRTIYRDVDALCAAGVPVYAERGASGGIVLAEGYRRALTHFGESDVRALFISGSAILRDLGLGSEMDVALDKLRGSLSEVQRRAAEAVRGRIHIDQRRWNQDDPPTERLAALRRFVWDDRRIGLDYEDRNGTLTTRAVEPYGLVSKAGVWYLVARTVEGYRSFRVDRMRALRETDERFARDPTFDLDAYWKASSAGIVAREPRYAAIVHADGEALAMLRSFWNAEPVEGDPLRLRVWFESQRAAVRGLVAWGDTIELIDPPELRAAVAAHARVIAARYAGDGA